MLRTFAALLLAVEAVAAPPPVALFQDVDYDSSFDDTIDAFWKATAVVEEFEGTKGLKLRWFHADNPDARDTVVVLPGFRESFLKYKEVAYDFHRNGFSVLGYDHRGQGLSPRVSQKTDATFVESFDDYVQDLRIFLETTARPRSRGRLRIFAHSMGAAIATRLMETSPGLVERAVFASPMHGVGILNMLPAWFLGWYFRRNAHRDHEYGPFQRPAGTDNPVPFFVTSSSRRRKQYEREVKALPHLLPGEASIRWMAEAHRATSEIRKDAHRLTAPVLLLQAGHEWVVDNDSQREVCRKAKACRLVVIDGARHEIWNEDDEARLPALTRAIHFLRGEPER